MQLRISSCIVGKVILALSGNTIAVTRPTISGMVLILESNHSLKFLRNKSIRDLEGNPGSLREVLAYPVTGPYLLDLFSLALLRGLPGLKPVLSSKYSFGGKKRKQKVCFCTRRNFPTIVLGQILVATLLH